MKTFKKSLSFACVLTCIFHLTHCMDQENPFMNAHESFEYRALSHGDEAWDKPFIGPVKPALTATRKNSFQVDQQRGLLNAADTDFSNSEDEKEESSIACLTIDLKNCLARCCLCFRRK